MVMDSANIHSLPWAAVAANSLALSNGDDVIIIIIFIFLLLLLLLLLLSLSVLLLFSFSPLSTKPEA